MSHFPEVKNAVRFEGSESTNPLAFKRYDAKRQMCGKAMAEHLKFAVCYWHAFKGAGAEPFSGDPYERPHCRGADSRNAICPTMDVTLELGGTGYVFWGGREGYVSLINTNMKQEREQLARFMHLAVDYAMQISFKGKFLIGPRPKEPSTHQYDFDAATALGYLQEFGLTPYFQLNIEANHATLATHSFAHDLRVASDAGVLGSIDANRGDSPVDWDTEQFPTNLFNAGGRCP